MEMTKTKNVRKMRELVAQYHSSAQSQEQFAKEHGVSKSKLGYWIRKLGEESHSNPTSNFVTLTPKQKALPSQADKMYIRFSGIEIEIPLSCLP